MDSYIVRRYVDVVELVARWEAARERRNALMNAGGRATTFGWKKPRPTQGRYEYRQHNSWTAVPNRTYTLRGAKAQVTRIRRHEPNEITEIIPITREDLLALTRS